MSWAHAWLLAFAPVVLIAGWWLVRRLPSDTVQFVHIRRRWAGWRGLSERGRRGRALRGASLAAGAALVSLALARPQWGEVSEETFDQSREVMIALDLSRSMLADDVTPTRLARAKLLITALLDHLRGERVGLIVFSGTAFVQSPLSADYEVLRDFLAELDPSYLPEDGTDYEAMLRAAVPAFGQQGGGDRYLVVLSDGEALDSGWKALLPALHDAGIRVVGLGVGTPQGALVPDGGGGLVKDEHGAAVLSRLEPQTLRQLADATGGVYRDAATWVDIGQLVDATVARGEKGRYVERRNVRLQDRFQYFLAPGLLLLLLSYWLEFPLSPLARALPPRGRRPHPASAPAIAAALMALVAWQTSSRPAFAAAPDHRPPRSGAADQPNPLAVTVAELSSKPALSPSDMARLATDTITFVTQPAAPTDATRAGIIDDALAAVDRGESVNPRVADWPRLRNELERLRKVDPPQPQQKKDDNEQKPSQNGSSGAPQNGGAPQNSGAPQGNAAANNDSSSGAGTAGSSPAAPNAAKDGGEKSKDDSDAGAQNANRSQHGGDHSAQQQASEDAGGSPAGPGAPHAASRSEHEDTSANDGDAARLPPRDRGDDVQPLDAPEAGLADRPDAQPPPPPEHVADAAAGDSAAAKPGTRLVGGGRALGDADRHGDSALAAVSGALERLKDGDSPAVLFDRMNRAEGQPRPKHQQKNW